MLTLDFESLAFELKDGTVKHVGLSDNAVTVKFYDATDADVRAFGDERVKVAVSDDEGNDLELALSPEQARALKDQIADLEADNEVFE